MFPEVLTAPGVKVQEVGGSPEASSCLWGEGISFIVVAGGEERENEPGSRR